MTERIVMTAKRKAFKASEYRQFATECLQLAERTPLQVDRACLMQMAQCLLELAQKEDAAEGRDELTN
jgi:hypothetical protein